MFSIYVRRPNVNKHADVDLTYMTLFTFQKKLPIKTKEGAF